MICDICGYESEAVVGTCKDGLKRCKRCKVRSGVDYVPYEEAPAEAMAEFEHTVKNRLAEWFGGFRR